MKVERLLRNRAHYHFQNATHCTHLHARAVPPANFYYEWSYPTPSRAPASG